ncbi:Imm1 family immunity protein [Actinopolyspora mortivallis]|uniref:Imm1 family immunity protein n=1 Tax=Actinopolyspora mortivallis TaxID=33906 RepID=UPI0003793E8A|nr:Imm1 family immunity protein [Actinopolyspora mortivallis]
MGIVQLETAAGGPHLASDIDTGRYHDRFTAIPIERARTALREFRSTGGQRPTSVTWVLGDFTGAILQPFPDVVA